MLSSESQNEMKSPNIYLQHSKKQFNNMMLKYNKSTKSKNLNQRKIFYQNILKKILKIAKKENVNDYIVNEVHRNMAIKTKIVNTFGLRAVNHYDEIKKYKAKVKIKKSKFFSPLELYVTDEQKNVRTNSNENSSKNSKNSKYPNYKSHRYIKFPQIISMNEATDDDVKEDVKIKDKYISNTPDKSTSIIKINEYSFDNKNVPETEKNKSNNNIKNNNNDNQLTYNNQKYITPNKKVNNFINTNNSSNISLISSSKGSSIDILPLLSHTPLKTERNNSCYLNMKLKNCLKKRKTLLNPEYLNYINDIREKSALEEERKKRFFDNYKYGCDQFKIKYNFLKEKYFV